MARHKLVGLREFRKLRRHLSRLTRLEIEGTSFGDSVTFQLRSKPLHGWKMDSVASEYS